MAECKHCKKLREEIEYLIQYRAKVNGMVMSVYPDPYVMVRDLKRVLNDHKKRVEYDAAALKEENK